LYYLHYVISAIFGSNKKIYMNLLATATFKNIFYYV